MVRTWSSSAHFDDPDFGKLLAFEQFVDQSGSLVGLVRGHEAVVFLDGGHEAHDVDVHPAQELLVVAKLGGRDAELLELGGDQGIDVVDFGLLGILEFQALGQDEELGADGVSVEAGHDEGFAASAGGHEAFGGDGGRVVVVGEEDGQVGDVAVGAVGVKRAGGHLLGRAFAVEHGVTWGRARGRRRWGAC